MFRLEKVFQNDDSGYIIFINFITSTSLLLSSYIIIILNENSIYELMNFEIFKNSTYFYFSIILSISYFIFSFLFKEQKVYYKSINYFFKQDIYSFLLSLFFSLIIIFFFDLDFFFNIFFLYYLILLVIILFLLKLYFNYIYQRLIQKNIIQKNVMLIGTYNDIKKIISDKIDKMFVFKCCIITDLKNQDIKLIKSEFKFPIFHEDEDIRSILEYHSLGQIWIINGQNNKESLMSKIFKFSVDTLNINLDKPKIIKGRKLLADKYDYEFYEWSKFYGVNLFIKILIDKILSIFFIIIASPILIISSLLIYLEDGYPIFFTQNRTGWDGRRFKIYKLRSLSKASFDRTLQVTRNDKRVLKIGRIIRRYSIDELPQFFNVLNGEMSIVGPRPHMVEHDIHYSSIFNNFLKRHKCSPGITGWAQVNGLRGPTPTPEIMKKRMEYDLWYLNNWTVWLDIKIIFRTFVALLKYKGD